MPIRVSARTDPQGPVKGKTAPRESPRQAFKPSGPVLRGSVQDDLGLVAVDEGRHHLRERPGAVDLEERVVHDDHAVEPIANRVPREGLDAVPGEDARQRHAPPVRDAAALPDELDRDIP